MVKNYYSTNFLSFFHNFCCFQVNYKTGTDAAKTAFKRVVQKTAEATGDLTGNKKADKITSVGKSKEKRNKPGEIYIPPEKRKQTIDDLRLF